MRKFFSYSIIYIIISSFFGCAGVNYLPSVSETDVNKYEDIYLAEYGRIKSETSVKSLVKWVQPSNKSEECKVFVGTSKENDRTIKPDYKIFWDGDCKNGYAYGLGREFEKGILTDMEAIAIYPGKEQEPEYYYQKFNLNDKILEGDLQNGYFVETTINDNGINFNLSYMYGFFSDKEPNLLNVSSPLSDTVIHHKTYPNFYYTIVDFRNNEFDDRNFKFLITDRKTEKETGFGIENTKQGYSNAAEVINGQLVKRVKLPDSYYNKVNTILNEIRDAGNKALGAQQKALIVKKQYKKKICNDNIEVTFIDNLEYKAICDEDKYLSKIKEKLDAELAKINEQKAQKRVQLKQERQTRAQEMQAVAAQRQAQAAEEANLNSTLDNMNTANQLQQLNNNLFYMRMGW
ncbi:hypothetical protein Dacet_0550 [Denitrovibrio acetiphilus DSM 12809]|uniref:Lipoprotein n=1 Tax=Denitrovibrio acetiphilus (strain DSM 12809 / NBRC 114555 / N2460) TaxID=522772 RepID=D4H437_DENA2|nr:hypothetical protein [Denitrovibrio acetiphilus]ADD67348.1 hypothetical protein Dacet_0550 [Denitrovibrio acetiphilus DSM 12809]